MLQRTIFLILVAVIPLAGSASNGHLLKKKYNRIKSSYPPVKATSDSLFTVIYQLTEIDIQLAGELSNDFLHYASRYPEMKGKAHLGRAVYFHYNKLTSSIYHAKKSIDLVKKNRDSIAWSFALQLLAINYERANNYDLAIKTSEEALRLAGKLNNRILIANTYNHTGIIMTRKKNYKRALDYYFKALKNYQLEAYTSGIQTTYTNIGIAYKNLNQYDRSFYYQRKALQMAHAIKTDYAAAFAYNDLGTLHLLTKQLDSAEFYYLKAVQIRNKINERWELGYTYNYLGELYRKQGNKTKSLLFLNKAIELSKTNQNNIQEYESYEQMSLTFARFQVYDSAFYYHQKFARLKDEEVNRTNTLSAEILISNYEFDKKQQEITNLKNQSQVQNLQINKQRILLWLTGLGLFSLGAILVLLIRNKKLRLAKIQLETRHKEEQIRLEAQQRIQEDRKRISRELHDNIGANLTVFKELISDGEAEQQFSELKQLTEETIQELRKSVWLLNHEESTLEEWTIRLKEYFKHLKKVHIDITRTENTNPLIHSSVLTELFRVIQEGVNNALKHASCTTIRIDISYVAKKLLVTIEDDGIGIEHATTSGFGLQNMKQRISDIHGTIEFTVSEGNGTRIKISLPIDS